MERLTFLNGDDIWCVNNDDCYEEQSEHYCGPAIDRLAAYEDTGLDPENMAHWQEFFLAECDGRLVVLPCKVGDTVFFIRPGDRKQEIAETTIEKMVVKSGGIYMKLACNAMYETSCRSIGKNVFLTHEEAEKVLEGGRSNENRG